MIRSSVKYGPSWSYQLDHMTRSWRIRWCSRWPRTVAWSGMPLRFLYVKGLVSRLAQFISGGAFKRWCLVGGSLTIGGVALRGKYHPSLFFLPFSRITRSTVAIPSPPLPPTIPTESLKVYIFPDYNLYNREPEKSLLLWELVISDIGHSNWKLT